MIDWPSLPERGRALFDRLAFPLALGLVLALCWLAIRPAPHPRPAPRLHDFTACGLGQPVFRPIDVDGDPAHAVIVIATHFGCAQGDVNLWQTPPR